MRGLVRNHSLIRSLPKTAAAAMATATLSLNVLVFQSLKNGMVMGVGRTGLFQILILLGGLYILLQEDTGRRSTNWLQSLPVASRTIWTAHVRALVLAVSLLILGMIVVVQGLSLLVSRFDPHEFHHPMEIPILFVRPWLVMLAVALCLGAWRSGLADPLNAAGWNRWRYFLALGAIATLVILQMAPLPVALLPVLAAYVWARRQNASLPPALALAERQEKPVVQDATSVSAHGRRTVHWIVVRQLFKWPLTWILGIPITFLLGLVQGGFFSFAQDADFARYFNVWITVYMLIAFVGHFLENLHKVDHLPISRGLLMRWLLVPNLVALLAGGFIGTVFDLARERGESIAFENDATQDHSGLLVPVDLWRPVWGGEPPTVTAPWGETRSLVIQQVIKGLPLHLVKPFTTEPGASADFVAWQIARATEAAHGVELDPDEVRDSYLVTGPNGSVQVREEGLTLVADGFVTPRGPVGPILGLLMGFTVVTSLVAFWLIFRACGQGLTPRRIKTVFWTAMGVLMLFHLGGYGLLMSGSLREWAVTALIEGLAGWLGSYGPAGFAVTWAVGLLLSLAAWRLCARAFARVEGVRGGSSCLF